MSIQPIATEDQFQTVFNLTQFEMQYPQFRYETTKKLLEDVMLNEIHSRMKSLQYSHKIIDSTRIQIDSVEPNGDIEYTITSDHRSDKGFDGQTYTSSLPSGLLTVDLRGQLVEEALETLASRLDTAALTVAKSVHIIHGHGTGKLKAATRRYLSKSPYVESYRPGEEGEGGDGVTIVELR